ncbi:MAG: PAS domain S-box protein [Anaerolineae bacterium]|nr:PAS domain S-box protein [Anaerolineae bacterium]
MNEPGDGQDQAFSRYEYLFRAIPIPLLVIGAEGEILEANEAALALYGYRAEDCARLFLQDLFAGSLKERQALLQQLLGGVKKGVEWVQRRCDGSVFPARLSAVPFEEGKARALVTVCDLTTQREAEQASQQSGAFYRALVEASPDAITVTDLQGRVIVANQEAASLHGFSSPEELKTGIDDVFALIAPQDRERAAENARLTLEQGKVRRIEYTLLRKDGTSFVGEISAATVMGPEGDPWAFIGITRDISQRKKIEEELRTSNQRLALLVRLMTQLMELSPEEDHWAFIARGIRELADAEMATAFLYDPLEGTLVVKARFPEKVLLRVSPEDVGRRVVYPLSSRTLRSLLGWQFPRVVGVPSELLGRTSKEAFRIVERFLEGHEVFLVGLVRGTQLLGAVAVMLAKGKELAFPHLIEAFARYVTTFLLHREAEEALRESEARFRALFENLGDAFILLDENLRVEDVNDLARELLQMEDHFVGKPLAELWSGELATQFDFPKILRGELPRARARVRWQKDGGAQILFLDVVAYRVLVHGAPHVALLCRDVSEIRRLERALERARRWGALGRFASGVAHDFGNLLAVIRGECELLASKLSDGSEELQRVLEATEAGALLAHQLVDLSTGKPLDVEILHMNLLVQNMQGLLQSILGERIGVELKLSPDPTFFWGNATYFERVLMNLVKNARDAMPEGGVLTIETHLKELGTPEAQRLDLEPGLYALLVVRDTGKGIPPEDRERIFEPFFTTKEPEKRAGLGLSIVYGIVKQHKGQIEVESRLGQGSSFYIYFPAIDPEMLVDIEEESKKD